MVPVMMGLGGAEQGVMRAALLVLFLYAHLWTCRQVPNLTGRISKGTVSRFLSYACHCCGFRKTLSQLQLCSTNEQVICVLMLLVFGITVSEMGIRHAQCTEKCVLGEVCHVYL